jgi:hypothetical protein
VNLHRSMLEVSYPRIIATHPSCEICTYSYKLIYFKVRFLWKYCNLWKKWEPKNETVRGCRSIWNDNIEALQLFSGSFENSMWLNSNPRFCIGSCSKYKPNMKSLWSFLREIFGLSSVTYYFQMIMKIFVGLLCSHFIFICIL